MKGFSSALSLGAAALLSGCGSHWSPDCSGCFETFWKAGIVAAGVSIDSVLEDSSEVYDPGQGIDRFVVNVGIDPKEEQDDMIEFYRERFAVDLECADGFYVPDEPTYAFGENYSVVPLDNGEYSNEIKVNFADYRDCSSVYLAFLYQTDDWDGDAHRNPCVRAIWIDFDGEDGINHGYRALQYFWQNGVLYKIPAPDSLIEGPCYEYE